MDQSYLVYLSIILSLINLCGSVYLWKSLRKKQEDIKVEVAKPKKPEPVVPKEPKKPEPAPTVVQIAEEPKKEVKAAEPPKEKLNSWYLEATHEPSKKFSLQVEWSDGSNDIVMEATTPVELEFYHKKGVVPVKIVGIPPHEDQGVRYLWELNGFHWS